MKHLIITILFLLILLNVKAQLCTHEDPTSFKYNVEKISENSTNIKKLPGIDLQKLMAEDMQDESKGIPPRFGYRQKVNYSIENSGE